MRGCGGARRAAGQCRSQRGWRAGHSRGDRRYALQAAAVGMVLAGLATDGRPDHELVSESLLENRLRPGQLASMARDESGVASFYLMDQSGNQLRGDRAALHAVRRQAAILLPGGRQFRRAEARDRCLTQTLWAVLAVLGLGLLAAILVQVRYGLRPLRQLQDELAQSGAGRGAARRALSGGDRAGVDRAQPAAPIQHRDRRSGAHPGGQSRACAENAAQRARQRGAHTWRRPRPQGRSSRRRP